MSIKKFRCSENPLLIPPLEKSPAVREGDLYQPAARADCGLCSKNGLAISFREGLSEVGSALYASAIYSH